MPNQIITNNQPSIVEMSPLKDVNDAALVLRPKGQKGDSKEVTQETADDEIVARVKKMGWIDVRPASTAPDVPPLSPAPSKPATAAPPPPPAPKPEAPRRVQDADPVSGLTGMQEAAAPLPPPPEATQVMPPSEVATLVEQSKAPESSEPPTKGSRSRK